jgi:hypothetical protein
MLVGVKCTVVILGHDSVSSSVSLGHRERDLFNLIENDRSSVKHKRGGSISEDWRVVIDILQN